MKSMSRRKAISTISGMIDLSMAPFVNLEQGLFISGFWRSGTTWLQQSLAHILDAKTVFEPLSLNSGLIIRQNGNVYALKTSDTKFLASYLPFFRDDFNNNELLQRILFYALKSTIGGFWVRKSRRGIMESFRRRVIVKDVRIQFCLGAIQNTFAIPVIHIHRDPRAVIASLKRKNWWQWGLNELSLSQQLLKCADGREDFFGKWEKTILKYENTNIIQRAACYWAMSELYVREYGGNRANFIFLSYEDLLRNGREILRDVLHKLNPLKTYADTCPLLEASPTSKHGRQHLDLSDRIYSWEKELTREEALEIENVSNAFGLESRLYGGNRI